MSKPVLLYYCKQTHDMGGLVRAFAIADRLVHRFQVVVLNGGNLPVGLTVPTGVSLVQLPPPGIVVSRNVMSNYDSATVQSNIALRREMILAQYTEIKPQVLFIDTFPFGYEILADELLPTVERARDRVSLRPLVICSVTDLLSGERRGDVEKDDRISAVLDRYFDAVIVHSDPEFARLGEFLQPRDALTIPVYHSGFVVRERDEPPSGGGRDERVLVSPGSGINGGRIFRATIEAHRLLWDVIRLPMTIIADPSMPDKDWQELENATRELPALRLEHSVSDIGSEFAKVRWAVCDCAYNTMVDVISTRVSALLVPGSNGHDSEQLQRSQRLAYRHAARMLLPHHLNGASLANGIQQLIKFEPSASNFNLHGAEITANVIYDLSLSDDIRPDNLTSAIYSDRPRTH
ncbi:MAG: putative glycosyltransferase [Woeseiaceae bacterium]|jgi:predicted glycosyltransferase